MIRRALTMLRPYLSGIQRRWSSWFGSDAAKRWARCAFAEFEVTGGRREELLASIVRDALRLKKLAADLRPDGTGRRTFVDFLLQACQHVDTRDVRHKSAPIRSYVDVSVQTQALRQFAVYLASRTAFSRDPANVTTLLLEEVPDSRPALLAHAGLLIERESLDEAIDLLQRALRVQAVCPTAQQLLGQALVAQRKQTGRSGQLDGTTYDLTGRFCHLPFTYLSTGYKGDSFLCCCPGWIPFSVGNLLEAPSAGEVWNSEVAREIRRSVHDGDFSYCSRTLCSYMAAQKLPLKSELTDPLLRRYIDERLVTLEEVPQVVQLNHDPTCNLACPSCRTEIVTANAEERDTYAEATQRVILPLLRKVDGHSYISGGGEAFASRHFRSILASLNRTEYPSLYLYLITNGQLITAERWRQFPNLPEMIDILSVSIDAARAETYERLRQPGRWVTLMNNLEVMAEMRRSGSIRRLQINFVVQHENYREIPEFIELGSRLGVDSIWLQRLTSYGTYAEDAFAKADVSSPTHSEHEQLLEILRSPMMNNPVIDMRMLMPVLPEVVAAEMSLPLLLNASPREAFALRWGAIDA